MLHELLHNWAHWSTVPKELAEALSPAHVISECITALLLEGLIFAVAVKLFNRFVRKHDKTAHPMDQRMVRALAWLDENHPGWDAKVQGPPTPTEQMFGA